MAQLSNSKHETYANFVASGMTTTKAAVSAGYSAHTAPQSGSRLLKNKQIAARVAELRAQILTAVVNLQIREKEQRLSAQQVRWRKMHEVIEQRAVAPEFQKVAGGRTGLMVRKLKQIGSGETAQVVEEYEVDTGLLGEIRKHEEHAAHELGQWVESTITDSGVRALMSFGDVTINIGSPAAGGDQAQVIEAVAEEVVDVAGLRSR